MAQRIVIVVFVILFAVHSAFGATITGTAPYLTIPGYESYTAGLNGQIQTSFNTAITQANQDLAPYRDQDKLATGFANANLYSTNSATHQGFQNYSLFTITTGVMVGVQAPTANIDYYTGGKIEDDIKTNGDLYAGVAGSVSLVNIGINAGFLLPGIYINGKFGKFNSAWVYDSKEFSFNTFIVGAGLTYSLFDEIGYGLLRWRGLTVGSGLVYQTTAVSYKTSLDTIYEQFSHTDIGVTITGNVVLDPSFNITLDMYTISVPFEVNTAVQLLWLLNLTLGAGVDVVAGNADLVLKAASDATIENVAVNNSPASNYQVTPGNLYIDGSTKGIKPTLAHARVMTGIGFNLGPVKLDVPIIYYFNYGAAVGVTVGVVW